MVHSQNQDSNAVVNDVDDDIEVFVLIILEANSTDINGDNSTKFILISIYYTT